jgi:ComF family protein
VGDADRFDLSAALCGLWAKRRHILHDLCEKIVTQGQNEVRCPRCDRTLHGGVADDCAWAIPAVDGLRVVGGYAPPLRTAILALKYEKKRRAAAALGALLVRTWQARPGAAIDCIATVPMPPDRLSRRGYNHAALLADACARELRAPFLADAIRRTRPAQEQHLLNAYQRRANVADLFAADGPEAERLAGSAVLIVDDITTTGATLSAMAQAVRTANAATVWGLVLARPEDAVRGDGQ